MPDFSIADILARGYQQKKDLLAQPYGISNVAPALGQLGTAAFQVADQNRQRQSVLQAQQDYAKYLATDPSQRDPSMTQAGLQGAMSLGYNPAPPRAPLTPQQIEADAAAKARGTASAKPKVQDQNLTPEEMKALQGAMSRSKNPLAASMISFRGPRAKLMAQSLMKDPDWSPVAGEAGLASAKAGASAGARLTEGGSAQVVARVAQSAREQLDILQQASDKFPRSDVKFLNTPIIKLDSQVYPEAQNWLIAIQTARAEYATALNRGNIPSQEQIKESEKALPDTITPKMLPGAIAQLRKGLDATVKGMMTPAKAVTPGSTSPSGNSDPMGLGI
jgi:hypothetical protein